MTSGVGRGMRYGDVPEAAAAWGAGVVILRYELGDAIRQLACEGGTCLGRGETYFRVDGECRHPLVLGTRARFERRDLGYGSRGHRDDVGRAEAIVSGFRSRAEGTERVWTDHKRSSSGAEHALRAIPLAAFFYAFEEAALFERFEVVAADVGGLAAGRGRPPSPVL